MLARPYVQNVLEKIIEAIPAGYIHGKAAQRSTKDQVAWLHLRPCLARLSVEPAEVSEIAVDHEVFPALLCLLPPLPSQENVGNEM